MKRMGLLIALFVGLASSSSATEILRWQRLPLPIHLVVGQERVILMDRNVRVGVPAALGERLRVQSAGGAIYLRANSPIEPTRLQLQDAENGALILLCAALAWRMASARDISSHRRWALRTLMVVNGVFFLRLLFSGWIMLTRSEPSTMMFYAFEAASFLLPLAILELYLRARDKGGPILSAVPIGSSSIRPFLHPFRRSASRASSSAATR